MNFVKTLTPRFPRRFSGPRKKCRGPARRFYRAVFEALEERALMTTTLYLDYGDRFPNGVLMATAGALDSTTFGANPNIDGPVLTDATGANYAADTTFRMTSFSNFYGANAAAMRTTMNAMVRRYFEPLDINVVVVGGAASLAEISVTLGQNEAETENNDGYMLIAALAIGPNGDDPTQFATNGYGGKATGTDIGSNNNNDGTALTLLRSDYSAEFLGAQIAHEAGHLFGLQHTFGNDPAAPPAGSVINAALLQSDLMSYLGYSSVGVNPLGESSFFSRYPMVRGDGNLNNNDLASAPTPYDQLRNDPSIGPSNFLGNVNYVTGTGQNDIITIMRTGSNRATVSVQAFTDAAYTMPITVPGSNPASTTYSYQIDLAGPILVEGGARDDRIVLDGKLANYVTIRGMDGSDTLILRSTASSLVTTDYRLEEQTIVAGTKAQPMTVLHSSDLEGITIEAGRRSAVFVNGVRPETSVSIGAAQTVTVEAGNVRGRVNIAGFGRTDLTINDAGASPSEFGVYDTVLFATVGGMSRATTYTDLHSLTINGGSGGNRFLVNGTPAAPVTLNTGLGVDRVAVFETNGALTINGQDSRTINGPDGFDTVNVGLAGSVQSIRGGVTVTNFGAYSAVTVDDSADTVARTGVISKTGLYTVISGLIPAGNIVLRGRDLRSLTIRAGSGNNTLRIHDTPISDTPGGLTTTLYTGAGVDNVTVNGTSGGLALIAQGFSDSLTVGSDTTGLDRIKGVLSISSPGGANNVIIHDRPTLTNRNLTHTITAATYARSGAATVNLSDVQSFVLLAGGAHDTINVRGNPTTQFLSRFDIFGGPGDDIFNVEIAADQPAGIGNVAVLDGEADVDRLMGPNTATAWNITGANAGELGQFARFVAIENLVGGLAADTFVIAAGAGLSGAIDGGGGLNTLDYSATGGDASSALVARYSGDGNADDAVAGNNGTLVGGVTFAVGRVGQAFSFGGVDGFVQVPNSASLETPTISVEAWVNSTTPVNNAYVVAKGASGDTAASYALYVQGGGLAFYIFDGVNYVESPYSDPGIWDGNWHHVVGTFDGATVRLYVDGLEVGAGTPAAAQIGYGLLTTNDLFIGSYQGDAAHPFQGLIDEPSVYNRALISAEIQALYSNTLKVSDPVSLYRGEGTTADSVGGNDGVIQGDVAFVQGQVGQAFGFDGDLDYVDLGAGATLDLPGTMSVSLWVRLDTLDHAKYFFADFSDGNTSQGALGTVADASTFAWFQSYTDGTFETLSGLTPIQLNQWFHLSVVRDDEGKTVRLFVNGMEESSLNYAGKTVVPLQGSKVLGGSLPNFPADYIDGQLDEVGIYNRALSVAEIQTLYSDRSISDASGVVVNLLLGTASGLTGGIARIQNVIGSSGNDILVGNGGNVLDGGGGHDLLFAGARASILNGGDGEDLLIGGTTDYDRNPVALMAILAEWARNDGINDDYFARVANLSSGTNGAPILNATTVHSNGRANTLGGNAGLDFFFANLDRDLLDRDLLTEELIML
jgi:hypothetical protein